MADSDNDFIMCKQIGGHGRFRTESILVHGQLTIATENLKFYADCTANAFVLNVFGSSELQLHFCIGEVGTSGQQWQYTVYVYH